VFRANGGGAKAPVFKMKKVLIAALALAVSGSTAVAASITNANPDSVTVIVTEGSERVELSVGPSETVEFCAGGCFVEYAGNNTVLTGAEAVEVSGQELKFR
jgi:hypothetical protein